MTKGTSPKHPDGFVKRSQTTPMAWIGFPVIIVFVFVNCTNENRLDPERASHHVIEATVLSERGMLLEALEHYDKAITYDSQFAPAYLGRGVLRRRLAKLTLHPTGNLPIAGGTQGTLLIGSADIEKALCLDSTLAEAYYHRGKLFEDLAATDGYDEYYRLALIEYELGLEEAGKDVDSYTIASLLENRIISVREKASATHPPGRLDKIWLRLDKGGRKKLRCGLLSLM